MGRSGSRRSDGAGITKGDWKRIMLHLDIQNHLDHASATVVANSANKDAKDVRLLNEALSTPTTLTSMLFLEMDTSPTFSILNQDSQYLNTNLPDGSIMTFDSISKNLNGSMTLEDQLEYLPGGVMLLLFGLDELNNVIVQVRTSS